MRFKLLILITGGGFGWPGAVNAFLIAMVLFEPGTMRVDGADETSTWLVVPAIPASFRWSLPAPVIVIAGSR